MGTTLWALGVGRTHLKTSSSQMCPDRSIFIQQMSFPALGDPPIFPMGKSGKRGGKDSTRNRAGPGHFSGHLSRPLEQVSY